MLCLDQKYGDFPTTITCIEDGSKLKIYATAKIENQNQVIVTLDGSLLEWDIPYSNKIAKLSLGMHPLVITHLKTKKKITIWLTKLMEFTVRLGYGAERGLFDIRRHNFDKKMAKKPKPPYINHREDIDDFIE